MARRILCTILVLLALPVVSRAATPLESGTNANTWVFGSDGSLVALWRLGTAETTAATLVGAVVQVLSKGTAFNVPGTSSAANVLVNRLRGSYPQPVDVPPMSVVSLAAAQNDAGAPDKPAVTVSPADATYDTTIAVTVQAYPSPLSTAAMTLAVTVDGVAETVVGADHTLYLVTNGAHTVVATATQKDASGAPQTTTVTRVFTLDGTTPRRRDSDGDGVPDFWEVKKGLDPLTANLHVDSDGDGWSDFDELLRGSDPNVDTDVPLDFDGDGWSDWDEERRGTDPLLAESAPVARRASEVEYLLTGAAFTDPDATVPHPKTGQVTVRDTGWALLAEASTELAVWPVLRVPAGVSMVARAQPDGPLASPWVMRGWVHGAADATPAAIAAELEANGATWVTPAEWQAAYEAELEAWLVRDVAVTLHPGSDLGTALVEAVVAWYAGIEAGVPVLLGDDSGAMPVDAVQQAAAYPGGLDALHDDLASLVADTEPLSDLALAVFGWAGVPGVLGSSTTSFKLATTVQQPEDATGEKARYVARLVARNGLSNVLLFATTASPWEPGDDPDGDAVASVDEVAPVPAASTDPLSPDTDLDGVSDGTDPCPTEPANDCLIAGLQLGDTDADGVLDALDNCFGVANPKQVDTNDDGIGNACEAPARIATPVTNMAGPAGIEVVFTSMTSANVTGPVSVQWVVDGAPVSTATHLGAVAFTTPGAHVVELWAGTPGLALTDTRLVHVVGLTGWVCASLDCDDGDPCTVDSCSTSSGCANSPTPGCAPCGADAACNDGDPCTEDICDLATGTCADALLKTGTPCSDGNVCTVGDQCTNGVCSAGMVDPCNDDDPCTIDACSVDLGCTHADDPGADPALCPQCLSDVECAAGACVGGLCCESDILADGTTITLEPPIQTLTVCLAKGQEIAFHGLGSGGVYKLQVHGPDGALVASVSASNKVFHELESVKETGPHTLTVSWTSGSTPLDLRVVPTPPDAIVTMDGPEIPTTVELTEIGQEGEVHFEAVAGQELSITGNHTFSCPRIGLYSPSGLVVAPMGLVCGATWYKDRYTVTETGTWRIPVNPGTAQVGTFTFVLHEVPEDAVVPVPVDGVGVPYAITIPGERVVFELTAEAGERVSARVLLGSGGSCYVASLKSPSGAVVKASSTACGSWFTDVIEMPETGTYTLTVDPLNAGLGTYTAAAWIVPPDAEVPIVADGVQATFTTTTPGQDVIFLHDGYAGQSIAITLSGYHCANLALLAPSGATVFAKNNACVSWFSDRVVLDEDGEYALAMDIVGDKVVPGGKITVWDVPDDLEIPLVLDGPASVAELSVPSLNATMPIDLVAGVAVQIKGVMSGASLCSTLTLRDPLGAVLGSKSYCGTIVVPTVVPTMSGTHVLEVSGNGAVISNVTVTAVSVP